MKKKTRKRWFHYLIELVLVIIGITIAFWLNNLGEERKNNRQKKAYLTDIRSDLAKDSIQLAADIAYNQSKITTLQQALEGIDNKVEIDSVLPRILEIGNYEFFRPDNFTLTSLIQSGDLKLIDSESTKRELLRLLKMYEVIDNTQNNFLDALDENYFPMLISKVDMTATKAVDADFFYSTEMKNYCAYTLNETRRHIATYRNTQEQIARVKSLIDSELDN